MTPVMPVASDTHDDAINTPTRTASLSPNSCEAGGPNMLALKQVLVADIAAHEHVPEAVGRVLDLLIDCNDQSQRGTTAEYHESAVLQRFGSSTRCPLKPSAYLRRILMFTNTSPCNVLIAVVYLQRLQDKTEDRIRLTSFNIQRLLLTATMLASKVHDDHFASNKQVCCTLPSQTLGRLWVQRVTACHSLSAFG